MKKIYTLLPIMLLAMLTMTTFTSCEDEEIARTLEGTWQGNMRIKSKYSGRTYYATRTEVTFLRDVYRYSSGEGYWIDYYNDAPWGWDYVANHISWKVSNGDILVYFIEEDTDLVIRNYRLNDNRFEGTLWDGNQRVDFTLYHVSSPNWSRYDHWGYDYRYMRNATNDSTLVERPIRGIGD